jgi:hypothetical protein
MKRWRIIVHSGGEEIEGGDFHSFDDAELARQLLILTLGRFAISGVRVSQPRLVEFDEPI